MAWMVLQGIGLMLMVLLAYLAFKSNIVISYILALGMVGAITAFCFTIFLPQRLTWVTRVPT